MLIHECFFVKVNFFSYIQMAWKALPSLEQNKGSLVVISSLLGRFIFLQHFYTLYFFMQMMTNYQIQIVCTHIYLLILSPTRYN